jgi:hypothetical protein
MKSKGRGFDLQRSDNYLRELEDCVSGYNREEAACEEGLQAQEQNCAVQE